VIGRSRREVDGGYWRDGVASILLCYASKVVIRSKTWSLAESETVDGHTFFHLHGVSLARYDPLIDCVNTTTQRPSTEPGRGTINNAASRYFTNASFENDVILVCSTQADRIIYVEQMLRHLPPIKGVQHGCLMVACCGLTEDPDEFLRHLEKHNERRISVVQTTTIWKTVVNLSILSIRPRAFRFGLKLTSIILLGQKSLTA
jgi:hypothetical protein